VRRDRRQLSGASISREIAGRLATKHSHATERSPSIRRSQPAIRFQLAKFSVTIFSSALSDGAKYLNSGAVVIAVRLNRFPSYAILSGKNSCCNRCARQNAFGERQDALYVEFVDGFGHPKWTMTVTSNSRCRSVKP
jgi:hypothetical protein